MQLLRKNNSHYIRTKKIFAIILIIGILYLFFKDYESFNFMIVISFLTIIFIGFKEVFSLNNLPYGLSQIFYLFTLTFLGLAPLYQYLQNITLWGGSPFKDGDFLKVNILLIISLIIYQISYSKTLKNKNKLKKIRIKPISNSYLLITSIIATLYIFFIYGANISALIFRSEYMNADVVSGGGLSYLVNTFFIRPIPAICFLLFKFYKKRNRLIEFVLLGLMLLTNAPTGMPRFAVAAFYIPMLFIYVPFIRQKLSFPFVILFALLVIFPLLNLFRLSSENINLKIDLSMLLAGHFDSYQMMARVISEDFITYGYQLLGVVFFFVPRFIWPTKPIGSGYLIAHEYDYYFDNLSMNYFGEGYINFGFIGMFAFAIIMGKINGYFDRQYWINKRSSIPVFSLIYCISIGMEFAILRGALLNIFPVFIGYTTSLLLIYKIVKK